MKTMKFNKKLQLNKKTVSNLNGTEMNRVQGGFRLSDDTRCIYCVITGPCTAITCPSNCSNGGNCC
jgi:hypothetical protein